MDSARVTLKSDIDWYIKIHGDTCTLCLSPNPKEIFTFHYVSPLLTDSTLQWHGQCKEVAIKLWRSPPRLAQGTTISSCFISVGSKLRTWLHLTMFENTEYGVTTKWLSVNTRLHNEQLPKCIAYCFCIHVLWTLTKYCSPKINRLYVEVRATQQCLQAVALTILSAKCSRR